jgi:hypothetical protein
MSIFDAPLNKFLVKISVAFSMIVLFCITFTKTLNRLEHCRQSVITFYAGINYTKIHTVPKAAHISEIYLGVYMGASPLASKFSKAVSPFSLRKFPKAFNPPPFGNFREIQR